MCEQEIRFAKNSLCRPQKTSNARAVQLHLGSSNEQISGSFATISGPFKLFHALLSSSASFF